MGMYNTPGIIKHYPKKKLLNFIFNWSVQDHTELEKILNKFLHATYDYNIYNTKNEKAKFWRKMLYKIYMNTRMFMEKVNTVWLL